MLKQVENADGTIAYLQLIESVLKAYVYSDTTVSNRIYHGFYAVRFLRIWRQWIQENNIPAKHFTSQNAWEGLEMLAVLLIKLATEDNAENIFILSSQECEAFFRKLRSYTGVESTVVNVSMKSFTSRLQRIQLDEKLMYHMKDDYTFPKLLTREKKQQIPKANLSQNQIENVIETAEKDAQMITQKLGMQPAKLQPHLFLKAVDLVQDMRQENEEENEAVPDFLDSENDRIDLNVLNENDEDIEFFTIQDILFTEEPSGMSKN